MESREPETIVEQELLSIADGERTERWQIEQGVLLLLLLCLLLLMLLHVSLMLLRWTLVHVGQLVIEHICHGCVHVMSAATLMTR